MCLRLALRKLWCLWLVVMVTTKMATANLVHSESGNDVVRIVSFAPASQAWPFSLCLLSYGGAQGPSCGAGSEPRLCQEAVPRAVAYPHSVGVRCQP